MKPARVFLLLFSFHALRGILARFAADDLWHLLIFSLVALTSTLLGVVKLIPPIYSPLRRTLPPTPVSIRF